MSMYTITLNRKDVPDNMTENNYARMLFELGWDSKKDSLEKYEMNSYVDLITNELVYKLTKVVVD